MTTTTALDHRPLPWVVAVGIREDSELRDALNRLGGTVRFVASVSQVRQTDYHFLVCDGAPQGRVQDHMNVLQFLAPLERQGTGLGRRELDDYFQRGTVTIKIGNGSRAERFSVGSGATSRGLERLVTDSILSHIPVGEFYNALSVSAQYANASAQVIAQEVDGLPLGLIRMSGRGPEWWLLPALTTQRDLWLQSAFALWKSNWPDLFPPDGFGGIERWMTHAELVADAAISAHEVETAEYLAKRTAELDVLRIRALEASTAAEAGERLLLTAQGDELVGEVMKSLKFIDFEVVDSDMEAEANKAAKREDLQVRSELDRDWVALGEVKGYASRNAKTSDIRQLSRAVGFFESRTGTVPQGQWYVVNAQFSRAPDERPRPLASSPEDVEDFAKDGGLVVDTRELFTLLRMVQDGTLSKQDAQVDLMKSTGIYTCPEPEVEDPSE